MGRWSSWRALYDTNGDIRPPSAFSDFEGPGVYIFAARRGRGERHTLYVGSSKDVAQRLYQHGQGDNIWKQVDKLWENGYKIEFSVHLTRSRKQALALEKSTLSDWWLYPLNILGNPTKKWVS